MLDLGSGRGVWLDEWRKAGVAEVLGVDGDYVDRNKLAIPSDSFMAADLTARWKQAKDLHWRKAWRSEEHLPTSASATLVDSLTRASDRILFSAAVIGQGGEFHINEQPLTFWQEMFEARGYRAYDCIARIWRAIVTSNPGIATNSVLYVNEAGRAGLPGQVLQHALPEAHS